MLMRGLNQILWHGAHGTTLAAGRLCTHGHVGAFRLVKDHLIFDLDRRSRSLFVIKRSPQKDQDHDNDL